jgi:hypothetical protein
MNFRKNWIFIAPAAIAGIALFVFIGGESVKLLWNWLLPSLFGWRQITFWEGMGLLALCRILFGGFGRHGGAHNGPAMRIRERVTERMADRVGERWAGMTPEERDRFRQRVRERCGFDPAASESNEQ